MRIGGGVVISAGKRVCGLAVLMVDGARLLRVDCGYLELRLWVWLVSLLHSSNFVIGVDVSLIGLSLSASVDVCEVS